MNILCSPLFSLLVLPLFASQWSARLSLNLTLADTCLYMA